MPFPKLFRRRNKYEWSSDSSEASLTPRASLDPDNFHSLRDEMAQAALERRANDAEEVASASAGVAPSHSNFSRSLVSIVSFSHIESPVFEILTYTKTTHVDFLSLVIRRSRPRSTTTRPFPHFGGRRSGGQTTAATGARAAARTKRTTRRPHRLDIPSLWTRRPRASRVVRVRVRARVHTPTSLLILALSRFIFAFLSPTHHPTHPFPSPLPPPSSTPTPRRQRGRRRRTASSPNPTVIRPTRPATTTATVRSARGKRGNLFSHTVAKTGQSRFAG